MHRYHIVSKLLLILAIVDFAVTAPVLGQEKIQARVDVVHIPKDGMTMLGKRGGDLDKLFFEIFGDTEDHSVRPDSPEDFEKPESSSATRPSSSSQPSGLADGSMAVEQMLPSIHEEPLPVSGQDDVSPNRGNTLNDLPSSSSQPSGLAHGWTDVMPPTRILAPIHEEPVPVSSQVYAQPRPGSLGEEWNKMWRDLIEGHFPAKPEEPSAARPSSSSLASGPVNAWTNVKQLVPSIHEEPVPVSSQVHAPPRPGSLGEEWNKMWRDLIDKEFPAKPEESSATRPSPSSLASGPVDALTDAKQPVQSIPEESLPVSSLVHTLPSPGLGSLTESGYKSKKGDLPHWLSSLASSKMSSADHGLMGAHALPNPGLSTESGHDMVDVPQEIPVSSKKHDLQPMGPEPPGKRLKDKV